MIAECSRESGGIRLRRFSSVLKRIAASGWYISAKVGSQFWDGGMCDEGARFRAYEHAIGTAKDPPQKKKPSTRSFITSII